MTGDQATVSWTPNHDHGDQRLEVRHDGGVWTVDKDTLGLSATSVTTTHLLDGERYDARIVAYTEHTSTIDQ